MKTRMKFLKLWGRQPGYWKVLDISMMFEYKELPVLQAPYNNKKIMLYKAENSSSIFSVHTMTGEFENAPAILDFRLRKTLEEILHDCRDASL